MESISRTFSSLSSKAVRMLDLFIAMFREEWRMHSTLFGSLSFALFPVLIGAASFMSAILLPVVRTALPVGSVLSVTVALFVVMGMMVGGFGLLGKEVMNRRFGHASLLAYSGRTLPLTERFVFLNFVVKDIVYYFILWILPFGLGFMAASPFIGISIPTALLLLLSITLSFLTGLSAIFLLSVIYTRSRLALGVVLVLGILLGVGAWAATGINPLLFFPPLLVFSAFSPLVLGLSLLVILIPCILAFALFTSEYHDTEKLFPDRFTPVSRRLRMFPFPALTAKDFLDLYRSGHGIGQAIFSFLLPLGIIWFFLSLLSSVVYPGGLLVFFALVTGIISATMFTWITEFDEITAYSCLPVGVSQLITSKAATYAVLQLVPAILLIAVSLATGNGSDLLFILAAWVSVSFYALGVTIFLMGLSPSVMLYNARVFLLYMVLLGLPALFLAAIAAFGVAFLLGGLVLFIPAWLLFQRGRAKWDARDYTGF
jgi:hypothetical protein